MLYLKRVKIENFRQLRDIDVSFGVDDEKSLTVIRAENRTGKTTFQQALSEMMPLTIDVTTECTLWTGMSNN